MDEAIWMKIHQVLLKLSGEITHKKDTTLTLKTSPQAQQA